MYSYVKLFYFSQVRLIADLLKKKIEVYKIIFSNIECGTFFNRSVAHEMSSIPEDEIVESKIQAFGNFCCMLKYLFLIVFSYNLCFKILKNLKKI